MQMYIPGVYTQDGSGPARAWNVDIGLPGASQMQYIQKAIFDRGNGSYYTRVPAQDIILTPTGIQYLTFVTPQNDMLSSN